MSSLALTASYSVSAHSQTVNEYLASEDTIRLLIVEAPGFGHQVTAVTWAKRIRELGFQGNLEVVVEPYVLEKIQQLIPEAAGTMATPEPYPHMEIPQLRMTITEKTVLQQALKEGKAPTVNLAVIPAEDYSVRGGLPGQVAPGKPTPAADLGAKTVLRMQPYAWRDGTRSIERSDGKKSSLEDLSRLLMTLPESPAPSSHGLAEINRWLTKLIPGVPEKEKTKLAALLVDQSYDSLPFYCAHVEQVTFLNRITRAALAGHSTKPIRIWVGSEMSDFQWSNVINGIKKTLPQNASIRMVDLHQPDTAMVIGGDEGSRQVEVIRLAHRPPALFEYLVKTSTLPPAVTGKYSQNMMMQLGIPFLELKFFSEVQPHLNLTGKVYEAALAASSSVSEASDTFDGSAITEFWKISRSSAARAQFSARKITSPADDLVYKSLERTITFAGCDLALSQIGRRAK